MPTTNKTKKTTEVASPEDEVDFSKMSTDELIAYNREHFDDSHQPKRNPILGQKPGKQITETEIDETIKSFETAIKPPKKPINDHLKEVIDTSVDIVAEIEGTTLRIRTSNGTYKNFDLLDILAIDPDDLTTAFIEQPAIYGYFAVLAAQADDTAARADSAKDQEYALADLDIREEAARNDKKLTESQVKSLILADESYDKKVKQEHVTKADARLIKAIVAALDMRANMLVSLGAMQRHEMDMTGMQMKQRMMESATEEIRQAARARKAG